MENLIWDGVPAQRTRKTEKFDFAVVTMSAIDKPGAGRKFTFNKAAQVALGIQGEDHVSFGFSADGTIIAVRKAVAPAGLKLTKTCTLSDKRTYEFIIKRVNLDMSVENHFKLVDNDTMFCLEYFQEEDALPTQEELLIMNFDLGEITDENPATEMETSEVSTAIEEVEEAVMPEPEARGHVFSDAGSTADEAEDTDGDVW